MATTEPVVLVSATFIYSEDRLEAEFAVTLTEAQRKWLATYKTIPTFIDDAFVNLAQQKLGRTDTTGFTGVRFDFVDNPQAREKYAESCAYLSEKALAARSIDMAKPEYFLH